MFLPQVCPPRATNLDYNVLPGASAPPTATPAGNIRNGVGSANALHDCPGQNPYSPKCVGKSCNLIDISAGVLGDFYISRMRATGTGGRPQDYTNHEYAEIYFPYGGFLKLSAMDVEQNGGDVLIANFAEGGPIDLVDKQNEAPDYELPFTIVHGASTNTPFLVWQTDHSKTALGWVLSYVPAYEAVPVLGTAGTMAEGAAGLRVVPVFHEYSGPRTHASEEATFALEGPSVSAKWVETPDWVPVLNSTCDATSMTCPIPLIWAHIDYVTPNPHVTPREGQCAQFKEGTVPTFAECAKRLNWAGNCGDATSFFYFEKMTCGANRTFDASRSIILDQMTLTPSPDAVQAILDVYYTTKAPQVGIKASVGSKFFEGGGIRITFPTEDYLYFTHKCITAHKCL